MSEARIRKSHVMTWTSSALAILMLYVLSWGPVAGMLNNKIITYPLPQWADVLYQPLFAALQIDAFDDAMGVWTKWWTNVLKKP